MALAVVLVRRAVVAAEHVQPAARGGGAEARLRARHQAAERGGNNGGSPDPCGRSRRPSAPRASSCRRREGYRLPASAEPHRSDASCFIEITLADRLRKSDGATSGAPPPGGLAAVEPELVLELQLEQVADAGDVEVQVAVHVHVLEGDVRGDEAPRRERLVDGEEPLHAALHATLVQEQAPVSPPSVGPPAGSSWIAAMSRSPSPSTSPTSVDRRTLVTSPKVAGRLAEQSTKSETPASTSGSRTG